MEDENSIWSDDNSGESDSLVVLEKYLTKDPRTPILNFSFRKLEEAGFSFNLRRKRGQSSWWFGPDGVAEYRFDVNWLMMVKDLPGILRTIIEIPPTANYPFQSESIDESGGDGLGDETV